MQNILFINSALSKKCVALIRDQEVFFAPIAGHKKDLENILEAAQDLCNEAGCKLADIDSVVVVRGPGNFSAIRVGCIVAMSLANNLPCELFAIDSLSLLAAISESNKVAMSASKSEIYEILENAESDSVQTVFDGDLSTKITLSKAEQLDLKTLTLVDFDGRFLETQNLVCDARQLLSHQNIEEFLSKKDFRNFISNFKSSKMLEPLYIKPPNIHVKD